MSGRFSEEARAQNEALWEAQHQHAFVRELGEGTLVPARFQIWLRQDFLYLIEYARLLSLAAARSACLDTMKWMIAMAHGVLHQQMLLHRAYAIEFGIPVEELASGSRLPLTRAYTDHLLRTAALGSFLELVSAMLPSVWGHAEIGKRLAGKAQPNSNYARWIEVYSSPTSEDLARKGRELLDRLAEGAGPVERTAAMEAFATSSAYERAFWDMCLAGE